LVVLVRFEIAVNNCGPVSQRLICCGERGIGLL
jgi:hypothetical protein